MKKLSMTVLLQVLRPAAYRPRLTKGPGFTVTKIGDGVYAALGEDGGVGRQQRRVIVGSKGVAVIDTFTTIAAAKDLLAEIRKVTNLPIKYVINTHYHLDHVGGNAVFADAERR